MTTSAAQLARNAKARPVADRHSVMAAMLARNPHFQAGRGRKAASLTSTQSVVR